MNGKRTRGFTLVELLVVIGIIALLIGILLPALSKARQSAYTVKCGSNLHAIGQGMAVYLADNKSVFPAAYIYNGMTLNPQAPSSDAYGGYVNWSSYIFQTTKASTNANAYAQMVGWGMFSCPTFENGGLPPTNTFAGNLESGQPVDAAAPGTVPGGWNGCDYQAPRLAYTVNEAICPRNKFQIGFQGASRIYQYVRSNQVRDSSGTILATEWNHDWHVVVDTGEASGQLVCKSHRCLSGFVGIDGTLNLDQLPAASGGGFGGGGPAYRKVKASDLLNDPTASNISSTQTRLDWVGRNHGGRKLDSRGYNVATSNFLYVDGHVETKNIRDTLSPFQWGGDLFSLLPHGDLLQN